MRDILDAVAEGELSPEAAEARLRGYATGEAGRFDAARERRSGVPEAVMGSGKTPTEVAELVTTSLETTGRALATRLDDRQRAVVADELDEGYSDADVSVYDRCRALVAHAPEFASPNLDAEIGVVTAGTSDAVPAGEAALVAREMGATVERTDDVGVAALTRLLDQLPELRERDALVVAAGREGALPTVTAGLVDVPVIGLPVSTGYGHAGDGEAALAGMVQSCTALSVVNVDAGFTAGAQAGLIARQLDAARSTE
jgi:NCAIR mutase (PurE)-related protein